jgi:hypothetical protein
MPPTLDRADYSHQRRALAEMRPAVLPELRQRLPGHGPWQPDDTEGGWRREVGPTGAILPLRRQSIACGHCRRAGVEIVVWGPRSELRDVRYWGESVACR